MVADSAYIVRDTAACPNKAGRTSGPVPQPAIRPKAGYFSASCGPACNNYTGIAAGWGTSVDASGSLVAPPSDAPCIASGSGGESA